MERIFVFLGAISGAIAVAMGAMGTHALKTRITERMLEVYQTAAHYHLTHSIALIACAWAISRAPSRWAIASGVFFLTGILLFSGSLYALVFSGISQIGIITPLGGISFIIGWLCLARSSLSWT